MKTCTITNKKFAWVLEVDGQEIRFQGSWNADYFSEHYSALGYTVEFNNEYYG